MRFDALLFHRLSGRSIFRRVLQNYGTQSERIKDHRRHSDIASFQLMKDCIFGGGKSEKTHERLFIDLEFHFLFIKDEKLLFTDVPAVP